MGKTYTDFSQLSKGMFKKSDPMVEIKAIPKKSAGGDDALAYFGLNAPEAPTCAPGEGADNGRIQSLEANVAALRAESAALGAAKTEADAIIVVHNHPSGDPTPSKADLQLTKTLQSAAQLLGVKFLNHLILGSPDCEEGRGYVSVMEWIEHQ